MVTPKGSTNLSDRDLRTEHGPPPGEKGGQGQNVGAQGLNQSGAWTDGANARGPTSSPGRGAAYRAEGSRTAPLGSGIEARRGRLLRPALSRRSTARLGPMEDRPVTPDPPQGCGSGPDAGRTAPRGTIVYPRSLARSPATPGNAGIVCSMGALRCWSRNAAARRPGTIALSTRENAPHDGHGVGPEPNQRRSPARSPLRRMRRDPGGTVRVVRRLPGRLLLPLRAKTLLHADLPRPGLPGRALRPRRRGRTAQRAMGPAGRLITSAAPTAPPSRRRGAQRYRRPAAGRRPRRDRPRSSARPERRRAGRKRPIAASSGRRPDRR